MQTGIGNSVPTDLQPLDEKALKQLIDELFPSSVVKVAIEKIFFVIRPWSLCSLKNKLLFYEEMYEILFSSYFPKPLISSNIQNHCNAAGLFFSNHWKIEMITNYLENCSFHDSFGVYIHESFHAFLHFLSLCLLTPVASDVLCPPIKIIQIANQIKIDSYRPLLLKIAKKNLIGSLDRDLKRIDSYYMNVEILVDNLAELLFHKICPGIEYRRGYARWEKYISQRFWLNHTSIRSIKPS
jgi:hypothetical protein